MLKNALKRFSPKSYDALRVWRMRRRIERLGRISASQDSQHRHNLPNELIVSLTSFPRRFKTLDLTLHSLLQQSVIPDRIILWLADQDFKHLPSRVTALTKAGIDIRTGPDLRSYKKLVFALQQFPEATIATADDDVYYDPHWLQQLLHDYNAGDKVLACHRAHRIPSIHDTKLIPPYMSWERNVQDGRARKPSNDLLPTGVGGILYPPRSLHPDVLNSSLYMQLCPTADDLWFYWMARKAGSSCRKVGDTFPLTEWPGSYTGSLFEENATKNDIAITNLVKAFGDPRSFP